jgi:hypothetical protein
MPFTFQRQLLTVKDNQNLARTIKSDTGDSRPRICDMQFSQILGVLISNRLPEETLQLCQSFAKRRPSWRQAGRDTAILVQRLSQWASIGGSAMLVIQTGPRAEGRTKDLVVEVTGFLKSTPLPVFFYLSELTGNRSGTTLSTILKSLVFQVLRNDPSIVSQDHRLGNIGAFQAEHTLEEWISLTCLVFWKVSQCFILVENEDLYRSAGRSSHRVQQVIDTFNRVFQSATASGNIVKMLLVSYGGQLTLAPSPGSGRLMAARVGPPLPASRRSKQHLASQFRGGLARRGLQPKLVASQK